MYKHILVPVDLNDTEFAQLAVKHAVWLASKSQNATLHFLTVLPGVHNAMVASYFPKDAAQKMKKDLKQQLAKFAAGAVPEELLYDYDVQDGKPYKAILREADRKGCDLIVMPSHKRSKVDKMVIGSVAERVLASSPIPVLVIKPGEDA
ncbi:universal stress protein [Parasalinivibrio latis]|uniref:universal stress protein n=1 Tax=Parasalinivibrio latis TaxID=2952610 RepID=UPI0030E3B030